MSDHDDRDCAETRTDDLLAGFDAFRARGAGTPPPEPEPFPEQYETAQFAMPTVVSPVVGPEPEPEREQDPEKAGELVRIPEPDLPTLPLATTNVAAAGEYTAVPPPPPFDPGAGHGVVTAPAGPPPRRSKTRTGFILAAAAAIVIGLCAGAYSVVVSTDRSSQNASNPPATSASTSASPQADDAESSRTITIMVVVDSVAPNGFIATGQSGGEQISFTVQYTPSTKFGTTARPISRSQVVVGAHVWVRGRRTGTDTITASLIAGVPESQAAARTSGYAGV